MSHRDRFFAIVVGMSRVSETQVRGPILVHGNLLVVLELRKWSSELDGLNEMLSKLLVLFFFCKVIEIHDF